MVEFLDCPLNVWLPLVFVFHAAAACPQELRGWGPRKVLSHPGPGSHGVGGRWDGLPFTCSSLCGAGQGQGFLPPPPSVQLPVQAQTYLPWCSWARSFQREKRNLSCRLLTPCVWHPLSGDCVFSWITHFSLLEETSGRENTKAITHLWSRELTPDAPLTLRTCWWQTSPVNKPIPLCIMRVHGGFFQKPFSYLVLFSGLF